MKRFAFALLGILLYSVSFAQRTPGYNAPSAPQSDQSSKMRFRDRLVFGGGLGASFGVVTFVQVAPQVGIRTTPKWINGIGVNYMYFSVGNASQSIYGGSVWSRYFVTNNLFLGSEFEVLNREVFSREIGFHRRNVPIFMVGGGYFTGGNGLGLGLQLYYDLIGDPWSPYRNPIIRAGVLFGL